MNKLKVKDLMVTGAFSALYFICVGLGTLLSLVFDQTGNMMYAPAGAALLAGPVYMLLVAKVNKFGAISLVGAVMATFFFLSGYMTAAFLPSLTFGLLAELVAKCGHYKQRWSNLLSYIIFSFGNLGPIFLMWFMREAYEANLLARGKSAEYVARVMLDFTPTNVLWLSTTIVLTAVVGGLFGQYLLQRYFKQSGLVS
ncbi:MptD family putative ECF transporter S component [Streptococcus ruminantium]|uniref:MptD family putative ECF transporter S component n=1 Tax=Streptococcus ruminantium TaxID=1917441 RepID=UPI0012DEA702|nr:MptD family putative ECF transporter S component [Streptococcus ruminantium]